MKRHAFVIAAILALGSAASLAETPDPSGQFAVPVTHAKSRQQVASELQQALRSGDILVAGDAGVTQYELNPSAYPARPVLAGKTREQARAELAEALRTGDIQAGGEISAKLNELYPWSYGQAHSALAGRSLGNIFSRRY